MSTDGIWSDLAQWVGPTPNRYPGAMRTPFGLILHIQDGTQAGSIAWCKNPASRVSAHFFNPKTGTLAQLVSVLDAAWAEVAGNELWISVENEGHSGDLLTDSQLQNCADLMARCHELWNVPLQISNDPATVPGLSGHSLGGSAYGGHTMCPGAPILGQREEIIHRAAILIAGKQGPMTLTPADITAVKLAVWGYENPTLDQHDMRQVIVNAETNSGHAVQVAGAASAKLDAVAADLAAIKAKLGV